MGVLVLSSNILMKGVLTTPMTLVMMNRYIRSRGLSP